MQKTEYKMRTYVKNLKKMYDKKKTTTCGGCARNVHSSDLINGYECIYCK